MIERLKFIVPVYSSTQDRPKSKHGAMTADGDQEIDGAMVQGMKY